MLIKRTYRENNTTPFLLIPVIFLLASVIFLSVAIGMKVYDKNKKERCTERTQAEVVDIAESRNDDGRMLYAPVFSYTAGGQEYIKQRNSYTNPCDYSIGQKIILKYNPDNPQEFYAVGDSTSDFLIYIFGGISALFLVIAALMLAVWFKKRKGKKDDQFSQFGPGIDESADTVYYDDFQ